MPFTNEQQLTSMTELNITPVTFTVCWIEGAVQLYSIFYVLTELNITPVTFFFCWIEGAVQLNICSLVYVLYIILSYYTIFYILFIDRTKYKTCHVHRLLNRRSGATIHEFRQKIYTTATFGRTIKHIRNVYIATIFTCNKTA